MTPIQKAKIQAFCQDKILSDTIREVFWDAFMHPVVPSDKVLDVQFLAASRLSLDFLNQAFKKLESIGTPEEKEEKELTNIAL